jgi:uncharacterized DUF497 family protein
MRDRGQFYPTAFTIITIQTAIYRKSATQICRTLRSGMEFEWDETKAAINSKKHGVSFEEAKTVFDNPLALIFDDEEHSVDEYREIIIGHSRNNRLLLVSYTERPNAIRIISARLATRREREDYEQNAL